MKLYFMLFSLAGSILLYDEKSEGFYMMLFSIMVPTGYFLYRYRMKEYMKRQLLRNSIAQDLHDQIGSTLSSLSVYSKVAKVYQQQHEDDKLIEVLHTIGDTANETIMEMSDIVWAINPKNDQMDSIIHKIEAFAIPLCTARNIKFSFTCDTRVSKLTLEMSARKNLYLILKECLNNAIKHSMCDTLTIDMRLNEYYIETVIVDNGIGYNTNEEAADGLGSREGNGLTNIQSRAKELGARLQIDSRAGEGTRINLVFGL
jgi:signal transduction histidine kinase